MSALAAVLLAAEAVLPATAAPLPALDPCQGLDPQPAASSTLLGARDLATIADIGRVDTGPSPSPFAVSPDRREIAFVVRRGNPEANAYCQRLLVAPFRKNGPIRELDRGGELIRAMSVLRNFPAIRTGMAQVITPRWSPDGKRIAFLKRVDDRTQVWLVGTGSAGDAEPVTELPDEVEDVAWDDDGRGLVVATRPAIRLETDAIAREARGGFLFDDRFMPAIADRPIPTGPFPRALTHVDIATGTTRDATPAEVALLDPSMLPGRPKEARVFATGPRGASAWTAAKTASLLISPTKLILKAADGRTRECSNPECEDVKLLWWAADGRTLYALRTAGWTATRSTLLRWGAGEQRPRRMWVTDDALIGCSAEGAELVCAREGATRPRRLVAIDPDSGRERTVYEPSPGFSRFRLGSVQRFRFVNALGVDSVADLVLPPDRRPGQQNPMVVVQYYSDGFLRGGTGDEVPIQVLAARGFAVLSFARPDFGPEAFKAKTSLDLMRANRKDWFDRRSVQSSLEIATNLTIATGAVDPNRMGISGFSEGATMTQWALNHTDRFKVAALSHCCEDHVSFALEMGPAFGRFLRDRYYRFLEPGADAFWQPISLAINADKIDAPILIQTNDTEYEGGLDVLDAFERRGKAIELYVFENESHVKWQPAHRLAIYERVIDWFAFWLRHEVDCSASKARQYERWKAMKGAPLAAQLNCLAPAPSAP
ncbi:MAG: Atxe2 family lasso peptide isopeptidase [Novosphingobium sp.]|nr:Atxe2 family lasso peptide isopeptidase [Novosphingobium sp.]